MRATQRLKLNPELLSRIKERLRNLSDFKWSYAILILLLTVIIFFRRPDALLNAQPWAEDGAIFLQQAIYSSIGSIFIPYAGYYHTIPRVVALIAVQFGLANAPLIMNICALLISVFCISYIFRPQFRILIPNDSHRFFLAVLIACLPIVEIYLNITNIQWFLIVFLTLWSTNVVFNPKAPSMTLYNIFEMLFVIISFLSCPLSIILSPGLLFGIILKIQSSKTNFNLLLHIVPIVSLLGYFIACSLTNKSSALYIPSIFSSINMITSQIFIRFFYYNVHYFNYSITFLIACSVTALITYAVVNRHQYSIDGWLIFLFILNILVIILFRPSYIEIFSSPNGVGGGERYLFYPMVLLAIAIIRHISTFNASKWRYVLYILLIIVVVNVSLNYQLPPFQDYHFHSSVQGFDPQGTSDYCVPINPPGWYMKLPTNSTFIQTIVTCTMPLMYNLNSIISLF